MKIRSFRIKLELSYAHVIAKNYLIEKQTKTKRNGGMEADTVREVATATPFWSR